MTDFHLVWKIGLPEDLDYRIGAPIENALIESALIHARALAYFLRPTLHRGDIHFSDYEPGWNHPICTLAQSIIDPVSMFLAHALPGERGQEHHPGAWPIPEIAVALVAGLAEFAIALPPSKREWFRPDPVKMIGELQIMAPIPPTIRSEHPKVAALRDGLQTYLQKRGLMAPEEDRPGP